MKIKIIGNNEIISKGELRYMLHFFGDILLGKRLAKNISLELVLTIPEDNALGYCYPLDGKHRKFVIEINRFQPYHLQVETLAHEMVHLKQYARGELKHLDDGLHKWKGEFYQYTYKKKYTKKYANLPWEEEAHLSEPWLASFYREHCTNNQLEW